VVRKAEQEVEEVIREAGQKAVFDVGVHGIHPELVKLLGRLKFRYSYAQNVLQHSIEAAFICGMMAAELGLNEKQARRAALLHDIGKAVDHEVEGSHAIIGADLARRYGESPKIVNAIAAHHEEVKAETILAPLVDAADALSGARPGARREMLESYVRRLEELERICNTFKGVEKSYAVQAGREIRVIVQHDVISDDEAALMAREIARKIENEMTYPGQIKVIVFYDDNQNGIMDNDDTGAPAHRLALADQVGCSSSTGSLNFVPTDSNGVVIFNDLKPGRYCVAIDNGYRTTTKLNLEVYVSSDQVTTAYFGIVGP